MNRPHQINRRQLLRSAVALSAALGSFSISTRSYPAKAATMAKDPTSFEFMSNGSKVVALKQGQGSPVVIIHGLGGHKDDFAQVMAQLEEKHTVYAFDLLGFGGSARDSASVGIGTQAEVVKALLDSEKLPKATIVGNSLGGWIAATFAAKYPAMTDKLVVIDPAGLKVTLAGKPPVNFAPDTVDEMHQLLTHAIASPFAQTPEFAAKALAGFKASGEAATLGKLFNGFASPDNKDQALDDVLPNVKAPVLVIWGEQDGIFPVALADMVVGLAKGSKKAVIAGSSHFPQIDKPMDLSKLILDFAS